MKTLVKVLGVSLVILFLILMVGKAGTKPLGAPDASKGPVIIFDPPVESGEWTKSEWFVNHKRVKVTDYLNDLTSRMLGPIDRIDSHVPLTSASVPLIAAVYGANGNFTGHDGLTYKGTCEISLYLYRLINRYKVTDFSIQIKVIYAKKYKKGLKSERSPNDVLHSFYFILESSFKLDGNPIDPIGSTNCPHVGMCECNSGN